MNYYRYIRLFDAMHSFHSFLSNKSLKIVKIYSITSKKGGHVFANAAHQTTFSNTISEQQNLDVLLYVFCDITASSQGVLPFETATRLLVIETTLRHVTLICPNSLRAIMQFY